MRLKTLYLENFGPFKEYEVEFPTESKSCILITGKNNAGKTTIIRAISLINSALHFAKRSTKQIEKQLLKKDIQNINRLIHKFQPRKAIIEATFDNEKVITVTLDGSSNLAFCEIPAYTPSSMSTLFGFLPPLGQVAENETWRREYMLEFHKMLNC
jgi:predicted ATP-binding protein involved in virulence